MNQWTDEFFCHSFLFAYKSINGSTKWRNELLKEWTHWINDSVKRWIDWINESITRWIEWINESINRWTQE